MAAKRSADEDKSILLGYLHNISEVKTSRNNNRYFDGKIQTKNELQRLVVFSPEKHEKFRSAATMGKPVKLTNAALTPNRSQVEVHVNRRTEIEVYQEPMPFKRKLFTDSEEVDKNLNIEDFKEPYQTGTVHAKVIGFFGPQETVDLGWGPKTKRTIIIADESGSIELYLYEDLIGQVDSQKCYKFTNVSSRKHVQLKLTTTLKTQISKIDEIPNISEDIQQMRTINKNVEVQHCQIKISYKCNNCKKSFEMEEDETPIIKCPSCKMSQKRQMVQDTTFMKINLKDEANNLMKMVIFLPQIHEYYAENKIKFDITQVEEHFLLKEKFRIEAFENSDVIQKISKNY